MRTAPFTKMMEIRITILSKIKIQFLLLFNFVYECMLMNSLFKNKTLLLTTNRGI